MPQKFKWTDSLDQLLIDLVEEHGYSWMRIGSLFCERSKSVCSGKQCRERYLNYLNNIDKSSLTDEECTKIIRLTEIYGHSWTEMSKEFCRRSPNQLKNFWHAHTRRRTNFDKFVVHRPIQTAVFKKYSVGTFRWNTSPIARVVPVPKQNASYQSKFDKLIEVALSKYDKMFA